MRSIVSQSLWLIAGTSFALACSKGTDGPTRADELPTSGPIPSIVGEATFAYTGFYRGESAVRGEVTLFFPADAGQLHEPNAITGTWHLEPSLSTDVLGPQSGDGPLVGYFLPSGALSLNLHPNMADNNIYLVGFFDGAGSVFQGTWHHSTFVGARVQDRFRAVRTWTTSQE